MSENANLPCDKIRTIFTNHGLSSATVSVLLKDECNNEGRMDVLDKNGKLVERIPVTPQPPAKPAQSFILQIPGGGRLDLNCNGSGGSGNGCSWSIEETPVEPDKN